MVITNTTEIILGMDFIKNYKMDLRLGEFGDYLLYDTIAKITTPLEFVKFPKGHLPSVNRVAAVKVTEPPPSSSEAAWQLFQVSAVQAVPDPGDKPDMKTIPEKYQKLIEKYPTLQKPDFKTFCHSLN